MTNAQLDAEKDRIDSAAWRELNPENPTDNDRKSVKTLLSAVVEIESAETKLTTAADLVSETPEFDRIMSLCNSLEGLETEIRKQIRRMGGNA